MTAKSLTPTPLPKGEGFDKPFLDRSTLATLPAPLAAIERIRIAYVTQTRARGRYNAAFELWLVDDAQARPEHIQAEVMVWIAKRGLEPGGDCIATVDTPYGKADLFETQMQHWRYYAFSYCATKCRPA